MRETWQQRLRVLENLRPDDGLLERARAGSNPRLAPAPRRRRLLAAMVAFAVFGAASATIAVALLGHEPPTPAPQHTSGKLTGPANASRVYRDDQSGFAITQPTGWYLQPVQSGCGTFDLIGAVVSNIPNPLPQDTTPGSCTWPPSMSTMPANGVVILFGIGEGGAYDAEQTLPADTPVPIHLSNLHHRQGSARYLQVTFHHQSQYALDVWRGTEVSTTDHATAEQVVESIRPWATPRTDQHYGQCLAGWERQPIPVGDLGAGVRGIDALSANDAWAVGTYSHVLGSVPPGPNGPVVVTAPLALQWDGSAWRLVSAPDPELQTKEPFISGGSEFVDVAVVGPDDVWAVGRGGNYGLVEHWDGSGWSVVASPRMNLLDSTLEGVDGTRPDDVWAVGSGGQHGEIGAVVEHWDGRSWALSAIPDVGTRYTTADAVSASSRTDAWVVGEQLDRALALHWDGTRWTSVATPKIRAPRLTGVVDLAPNDAWAVGTSYRDVDGRGPSYPLVEHWDGTRWSRVDLPSSLPPQVSLNEVAAAGPDDVWVTGWGEAADHQQSDIVLHYDGQSWTVTNAPNAIPGLSGVRAVASAGGATWITGSDGSETAYRRSLPVIASPCG